MMASAAAQQFFRQAIEKSADLAHREIIRKGIDSYYVAFDRGRARFADWQAARDRCQQIKWEAVNHLDRYLAEFEQHVEERGGHVFWAANGEEARNYILGVAQRHGVQKVVKSKSMVSEEIHLAPALEEAGIEVYETDLGEFIVQLRQEPPYHIVTPAMHLTRAQIAKLFKEKLGGVDTDDPQKLVAAARATLRRAFFSAEMGISGANFIVADCGFASITTNEGNGRLGVSLPRVHVLITGIEKVVPRLADLAVLWPVLATAGTGQPITSYNTLVGGPRQPGETDGPDEFHVVLLDNGRSELLADAEQREILQCIRCGACLNVCPVFHHIGGHTYGTTYPGPIGSILTPHLRGLAEFQHLSYASSLCGCCTETCPVRIQIHHHLLHNRRNATEAQARPPRERLAFRAWCWAMMDAGRFERLGRLARAGLRLVHGLGLEGTALDAIRPWTRYRAAPNLPRQSFRTLWSKNHGGQ
jgi:L-lactate dehydrogenase complex protein LldF